MLIHSYARPSQDSGHRMPGRNRYSVAILSITSRNEQLADNTPIERVGQTMHQDELSPVWSLEPSMRLSMLMYDGRASSVTMSPTRTTKYSGGRFLHSFRNS